MLKRSFAFKNLTKIGKTKPKNAKPFTPLDYKKRLFKFLGGSFLAGFGLMVYSNQFNNKVKLTYEPTPENEYFINSNKRLTKKYRGTFYLPFGIMEGILAARVESAPYVRTSDEKILLKNGDFLDLGKTTIK